MRILIIIFLLLSFSAAAQTPPDSIVVTKNTYVNSLSGGDHFYIIENYSVIYNGKRYFLNGERIAKSKITALLTEIVKPNTTVYFPTKYKIEINWEGVNPADLLDLYSDKKRLQWNKKQKEFIFKVLTDFSFYKAEWDALLSSGGNYTMHNSYKNEYIIKVYNKGIISTELKSRKFIGGYKMPWITQSGDTLYNFNIETKLKSILSTNEKIKEPLKGAKLQKYLVNKIIESNMPALYNLSAYSFEKEILELKSDFKIVSFEEVYGRGRYIWNEPKTMKIVLKNNLMFDNVNLILMASKIGNTIYLRDSIKNNHTNYIERIQSVKFISDYLKKYPNSKLDIYYFNNKGINNYNIENVNKSPAEWKKHDAFLADIKKYDTMKVKPFYANDEALGISKQIYCGCNFRFERSYIENAIFFEVQDANNSSSIWFLLPDNKVLLYIMDDNTALNFKRSDFNNRKEFGIMYPCVLFDTNGNIIPR